MLLDGNMFEYGGHDNGGYVYGSGANHYVALRGDEAVVFDEFGTRNEMGDKRNIAKNFWIKVPKGDKDAATRRYVDILRAIPLDGKPHEISTLRAMCTRTGDAKVSTIYVKAISNDNHNGPFFPTIGGATD